MLKLNRKYEQRMKQMILILKQKILSWFDSYNIYNQNNEVVFIVKGRLNWGHRLEIYDANMNYLGQVVEKIFTFLPKVDFYIGNTYVGQLKKQFTFFKSHFILDYNNWQVSSDFWEWNYTIVDGRGEPVMYCTKKILSFVDTYIIDIKEPSDALICLMIALSIDLEKDTRHRNSSN